MQRACSGCGSTDHLPKDCRRTSQIQSFEEEAPEVLFIGNVQNQKEEEWKHMLMKVKLGNFYARSRKTECDSCPESEDPV